MGPQAAQEPGIAGSHSGAPQTLLNATEELRTGWEPPGVDQSAPRLERKGAVREDMMIPSRAIVFGPVC